jgi:hypothetical protein
LALELEGNARPLSGQDRPVDVAVEFPVTGH